MTKKYINTLIGEIFVGFGGGEIDPKFQKIIFIGGSTGNQKYTPEELTIVEQLNKKLINKNINEKIYNYIYGKIF